MSYCRIVFNLVYGQIEQEVSYVYDIIYIGIMSLDIVIKVFSNF